MLSWSSSLSKLHILSSGLVILGGILGDFGLWRAWDIPIPLTINPWGVTGVWKGKKPKKPEIWATHHDAVSHEENQSPGDVHGEIGEGSPLEILALAAAEQILVTWWRTMQSQLDQNVPPGLGGCQPSVGFGLWDSCRTGSAWILNVGHCSS